MRNGQSWSPAGAQLTADKTRSVQGSVREKNLTTQTTHTITCANNAAWAAAHVSSTAIVNVIPGFSTF